MQSKISARILKACNSAIKPGLKTVCWMARLTILVSLIISVLQYLGYIYILSQWLDPAFRFLGLPGESAIVFISGYFVNIYSAVAAAVTLNLDNRSITILAVMALCAHNMIVETTIQKKTGSSAVRMVIVRTLSAIILAIVLNMLLPESTIHNTKPTAYSDFTQQPLKQFIVNLLITSGKLLLKMFILIMGLNMLQKILVEFGAVKWISKFMAPVMKLFGLPEKCSFLWIVANILGLAYGSAVMLEEIKENRISKPDADLLNYHIGIAHSNLEDVSLFFSIGAGLWWILLTRWVLAVILVWCRKLELRLRCNT